MVDELFVEELQRVVDHAGVVVLIAHLEHVAVGDAPDVDPAQRLVAVITVGPMEQSVDVVAVLGLLEGEQVLIGLLLARMVDQFEHLRGRVRQFAPVVAGQDVVVVFVGIARSPCSGHRDAAKRCAAWTGT